ncbi:FG-GAP-like repeat-containing protein [Massilia sp. CFBP9026]|uniref:FG-GAP-like repeat-containing protein n=1 Tax=Massilia sp. CFBP9026 TaxID=3096536 RepID=UPI002A6AD283|nr:FG-GAP-like repeat-containing protein [Massilia sp. CFBP9026]MDY0960662.1 FG-GAP-like repeat-containing protein [Massilia sp. CFBP9026]
MTFDPCAKPRNPCWTRLAAAIALAATTIGGSAAQAREPAQATAPQWRQQTDVSRPTARHENGFAAVAGRLILLGGRGERPLEIYDQASGRWTKGEAPPFEIHHLQGVEFEGKLVVLGALTGKFPEESPVPHVLIYDPAADRWSKGPGIPPHRRRGASGVAVHDGIIYLVGGNRRGHMSGYVAWFDAFDPATGRWIELPDAPHARDHFHAAVIDGKLYAAGGRRSAHDLGNTLAQTVGEVDVYDFKTKRWSTLPAPLPTQRAGTASAVIDGKLAVMGGESMKHEHAHREVEAWDPKTARWHTLPAMPVGRHGTQAATLDGKVYIAAGSGNRGGGPELDDLWRIEPGKPGKPTARDPAYDAFSLIPEAPGSGWIDATLLNVPVAPALHATDSVFIDVDHDGDLDVVISVEHGVNRLYRNDGGGKLTYVPDAFGTRMHDSEHVRAADFNRDGHMDVVFVAEADENHQLYLGDGRGGFVDASARLPAHSQGNGLAVGDVNGDGLPDIFIGSTGEAGGGKEVPAKNLLFLGDPKRPGYFIDASATHLPQANDQTEGAVLADMDGDGHLDLVLASPSQPNRLLINDGKGRFKDASDRLELKVPMETREVHVLDVNGDGKLDIVFFNITSNNAGWEKDPQTRLLVNDGKGNYRDETEARLPAHTFSSWAGTVVDFNGDGAPDLLVGAIQVPGFVPLQPRAWQNDGKGNFKDVTLSVLPGVTVGRSWSMGRGDLDGDGKDDVFIGGWGTQARLLLSDIKKHQASLPPVPKLEKRSR